MIILFQLKNYWWNLNIWLNNYPLDTGRKLDVYETSYYIVDILHKRHWLRIKMFSIHLILYNQKILKISDVLLELSKNTVRAWKEGTTPIVGNSILSGFKESKMSQKRFIKVRTFPGATIQDMKIFVHISTKSQITLSFMLELITPPTPVHNKCFMKYKVWEISFWNVYHLWELWQWYCVLIRPTQMTLTKLL